MPRYSYRARRPNPLTSTLTSGVQREVVVVEPEPVEEPVPYRDLQDKAKQLDIPANQSRGDLEAAIAESETSA